MPASMIAVVGAGAADVDPAVLAAAEIIGAGIADAGAVLVCGGLGGVMAAAARGATARGGTAVGLLPGAEATAGNPYLTLAIPTGLGEARNMLVVRAAAAVIAVGGEYGTLSEIAFALKLGIPVIGLDTWQLHRREQVDPGIVAVDDPVTAVAVAVDAAGLARP